MKIYLSAAFAALIIAPTVAAPSPAHANDHEPGAGFILEAPAAAPEAELRTPTLRVTPVLDDGVLASHFEPRRADAPASSPTVYESRYRPRTLPPNHPPIGPPAQSRYQPRVIPPAVKEPKPYPRGFFQMHGGVTEPEGNLGRAFVGGIRAGSQITPMLQLGLGADWRHKTGQNSQVVQEGTGPGGEPIVVYRDLSRYSSDLLPTMAYAQLSLPASMVIAPYFGIGAGWQFLWLSADDNVTATTYDADYNGFGWQMWAGAGIRISGRTRLFGEAFYNEADLDRNVYDYALDVNFRERIHDESVGARAGFSWGF